MANKSNSKNSKSNKTAHVLNLLSGAGSGPEAAKAQNHPQAVPAAPAPDNSEAVSEAIRNALEEDLLAELEASEPAPQPEEDFQPFQPENVSQPQPVPAAHEAPPEPAPAAEAQPEPAPAPQPEPAPAAEAQPEPAPAPQPEPAPAPAEVQPESHGQKGEVTYINVMQTLVEDKADKYIQRTHMCTCNRCRTDVIALTLSSLPAKYIVVPENESIPMLSVYEGRYEAAITAQLMWACQKVAAHPRHTANSDGSMRLGAPRKKD